MGRPTFWLLRREPLRLAANAAHSGNCFLNDEGHKLLCSGTLEFRAASGIRTLDPSFTKTTGGGPTCCRCRPSFLGLLGEYCSFRPTPRPRRTKQFAAHFAVAGRVIRYESGNALLSAMTRRRTALHLLILGRPIAGHSLALTVRPSTPQHLAFRRKPPELHGPARGTTRQPLS